MDSGTHVGRRPLLLVIALVAALSASLAVAGAASATKLGSGNTTLTMKKSVKKKLKKAKVKVKVEDGATKAGKVFTFPITGGDLAGGPYNQAGTASGTVDHSGGLKFTGKNEKGKKKSFSIGDFLATFSATSTFASTSGKTGTMLNLGTPGSVSADNLTISGVKGKTAKKLKKQVQKKFGVNLKSKTFGTLDVAAVKDPNVPINAGGTTKLTFAGPAFGKLATQDPSVIAPATLGPPAPITLTVPVTGGTFNTQTGLGEISHAGGVALADCAPGPLTLADPTVLLTASGVALNVFSSLTGGRVNIADVAVTGHTVSGNTHTLTGNVAINAVAAGALNGACDHPAFPPPLPAPFAAGEALGTATVVFTTAG